MIAQFTLYTTITSASVCMTHFTGQSCTQNWHRLSDTKIPSNQLCLARQSSPGTASGSFYNPVDSTKHVCATPLYISTMAQCAAIGTSTQPYSVQCQMTSVVYTICMHFTEGVIGLFTRGSPLTAPTPCLTPGGWETRDTWHWSIWQPLTLCPLRPPKRFEWLVGSFHF